MRAARVLSLNARSTSSGLTVASPPRQHPPPGPVCHRGVLPQRDGCTGASGYATVPGYGTVVHPRTGPRTANPGGATEDGRPARGLVACLGPDPAPSPWGFVSGVGAQTGSELVVDGNCNGFGGVGDGSEVVSGIKKNGGGRAAVA